LQRIGKFIILNKKDVGKLITVKDARLIMEQVIKSSRENITISIPPRMVLDLKNENHDLYQFRAGYLKEIERIGLRIANLRDNETRQVLLIDVKSSNSLGLINESETFKLRIGGTVANIIKYLAKKDGGTIGLIGAGSVARGVCRAIDEIGLFKTLKVYDKYSKAKKDFVQEMGSKIRLKIKASPSVQLAVRDADVIITATTANEPLVESKWVQRGCLVISLGMGQELEPDMVCGADKIIVDDIELCKGIGDIAYLMKNGFLKEDRIYGNLYEILRGIKRGRENGDETIVVISQGMIAGDIALVNFVYEKAMMRRKTRPLSSATSKSLQSS
jgi:alanine dehydrogenase